MEIRDNILVVIPHDGLYYVHELQYSVLSSMLFWNTERPTCYYDLLKFIKQIAKPTEIGGWTYKSEAVDAASRHNRRYPVGHGCVIVEPPNMAKQPTSTEFEMAVAKATSLKNDIEMLIARTPTSERRNTLTEANIFLQESLSRLAKAA